MFSCVSDSGINRKFGGHMTELRVTVATRFQGFLKGNLSLALACEMI